MNRREQARQRIVGIRQAAREGRDPEVAPTALALLREACGDDTMRVWQLAESVVVEGHARAIDDVAAAEIVVKHWRATTALVLSVSGRPLIPLADTGMYP